MVGVGRLASALALLLVAAPLGAQGVSVSASVTPQPVPVNGQFVLNVEIAGTQQLDRVPSVPGVDFADYLGSGTTTSMQMINGRTTVSVTVQYRFRATKEGTFTIPPIAVMAGGTTLQTEPVTVTVSRSAGTTTTTGADGSVVEIPEDALFVTATPNKRRVVVNEPVIVEYRIYTRLPVEGYTITASPAATGFWVEQLETPARPQVETVTRNGQEYASAVIGRSALFPTSAGTKTIAPLAVEAQVQVERRGRDPFGFPRGLLAQRVPVVVSTSPIAIEVAAPPAAGRPDEFTGFVGRLDAAATVDKTDVGTNEALTYRLRISGEGNLQTLAEPAIVFPDAFEVYPPQTTDNIDRSGRVVRGSKTYEYVLIPRVPGTHTIPATRYGYFDASSGRYAVAATEPIRVSVTGAADVGPLISVGGRGAVTTLRQDIRFIRVAMPRFARRERSLFGSASFWIVALVPLSVLGLAARIRRHHDRLAGDVAFARGRRAGRTARRRLKRARSLVAPDQAKAFHAEVGSALRGFLGDKLNVSEAGMVEESVRAQAAAQGAAGQLLDEYFACVELCDRYRFAPVEVTVDEMNRLVERAERVMTDMERALR